ncbi:glutathione binding-like protein [Burkholderia sp. BCC0419]|uniref:glutathione binding-like protein n=1 Tax=Burkholderia sp. BCC0419 TaxID=486878 RepID=UPI001589F168|nr:glutathione binding-like protein [Burkholderia sp. BCC0419]
MKTDCFFPPEGYVLGIPGGPILPQQIFRSPLMERRLQAGKNRYSLVYSAVAPSGQKLALAVICAGLLDTIGVLCVEEGKLSHTRSDDANALVWTPFDAADAVIVQIARQYRLPALVDLETHSVVSNDPYTLPYKIIFDLGSEHDSNDDVLNAARMRRDDHVAIEQDLFYNLHAAVYRSGFLDGQASYDAEVAKVYDYLHRLDATLVNERYLAGDALSIADLWLFSLLIRYDNVYATAFRLHKYRLRDFSGIWRYVRRLYQKEAFCLTTNFDVISRGYFLGIPALNRGVVPRGPDDLFLSEKYGRMK